MKVSSSVQKIIAFLAILVLCAAFTGCGAKESSAVKESDAVNGSSAVNGSGAVDGGVVVNGSATVNGGPVEENGAGKRPANIEWWYEAAFLDKEEAAAAFSGAVGAEPIYKTVPSNYHITTEYMGEQRHPEFYGETVTVHVIRYTNGTVQDPENGKTSENEGFLVELSTENKELQELFDSFDKTWHITRSYNGEAKYTEQLDFDQGKEVDFTLTGKFGITGDSGVITTE